MILFDADVLLIDIRYPQDRRFQKNREALDQIRSRELDVGLTAHTLLEIVGILSFNLPSIELPNLPGLLCEQYHLAALPPIDAHPEYAGCTFDELIVLMAQHMALGDAVQAVQIEKNAPTAACLLTWNAKHFLGKIVVPVLTPAEWLISTANQT